MIQEFITIAEKLVQLIKSRKEAEDRPMDLIVIPMYAGLNTIHSDYLQMFHKCMAGLQGKVPLPEITRTLLSDRIECEALRHSIVGFLDSYVENPRLRRYRDFFRASARYLRGRKMDANLPNTRSYELLKDLLKWLHEGEKQALTRDPTMFDL